MSANTKTEITIETTIKGTVEKIWKFWTAPEHITKWNHASDDWHSPRAENDLRPGGKFNFRMEAKDGSFGFDFTGTYTEVKLLQTIAYTIEDGRKVKTSFSGNGNQTKLVTVFEAETTNPVDMQREGWLAILNNFRKYVEAN